LQWQIARAGCGGSRQLWRKHEQGGGSLRRREHGKRTGLCKITNWLDMGSYFWAEGDAVQQLSSFFFFFLAFISSLQFLLLCSLQLGAWVVEV
jgi:hypothetical protein